MVGRKKNRVGKVCERCSEKFEVIKYRENTARFCSRECFGKSRIGEIRPKWIGKKISKKLKGKPIINRENYKKYWESKKGIRTSIDTEFKKGQSPWNKGKIGVVKLTQKQKYDRRKIAIKNKSHLHLLKYLEKNGTSWNKGKPPTEKTRKNMSKAQLNRYEKLGPKGHPNWQGGKSFEPYPITFNRTFKRLIRKRDNYICMACGKHQEKEKRSLDIHHINYDKNLTIPENCVTTCRSCNAIANKNRKHWIKFFQSLLSERYGYNYENQDIIIDMEVQNNAMQKR